MSRQHGVMRGCLHDGKAGSCETPKQIPLKWLVERLINSLGLVLYDSSSQPPTARVDVFRVTFYLVINMN